MKFILFIMLGLFTLGGTFTSCTPTEIAERVDLSPTEGEDGEVENDPNEEEEGGNG